MLSSAQQEIVGEMKLLVIDYDKEKNYTYKYSLDNGKTWTDASVKEVLENVSGNVIALVLEDGNYKMSSTYYIK